MLFQHEREGLFVGQVILDASHGLPALVAGHRPPLMAVEDQAVPGRQRAWGKGYYGLPSRSFRVVVRPTLEPVF